MRSAVRSTSSWSPMPDGGAETRLSIGAASHRGMVRTTNEDGWLACPPVFLVADGMGGHEAGDVASRIVVDQFKALVTAGAATRGSISRCIQGCQDAIAALATDSQSAPGSTLVAVTYVIEGGVEYWLLANIGDSRAYLLTESGFEQLSKDHSVVQEMIDAGEIDLVQAKVHPERHVITRALGALADSPADFSLIPVTNASTILLCSDGITSEIDDEQINEILNRTDTAGVIADDLVTAALLAGGHDNATAVVVQVVCERTDSADVDTSGRRRTAQQSDDTIPNLRSVR